MESKNWAITSITHPGLRDVSTDCDDCLELAKSAVIHARVMGSSTCIYSEGDHGVTVSRALTVIDEAHLDESYEAARV